jgi:hypothetical protein
VRDPLMSCSRRTNPACPHSIHNSGVRMAEPKLTHNVGHFAALFHYMDDRSHNRTMFTLGHTDRAYFSCTRWQRY